MRNTVGIDPLADVLAATRQSAQFTSIRTGLLVGATCVLVLIGASLLVSQEAGAVARAQEAAVGAGRLRHPAAHAEPVGAVGRRRSRSVSASALASTVGLTLGTVLLKMTATPVVVDWASVLTMTGIGGAVVLAVTLLSLPPLLRMMRPDGLRTE
ncbi:hypothetical protein ACRAWF_06055 [Streptomyces sp. L7]